MNEQEIKQALELKRKQIEKYFKIMNLFQTENIEDCEVFQRNFNAFYRVRRNVEFRKIYYSFLNENRNNTKLTFEETLGYLKKHTGNYEASFSSKLIATINPEMPIWDSIVLQKLNLKTPGYKDKNKKEKIIKIYDLLVEEYSRMLASKQFEEYITIFDTVFKDNDITKIKKIDFVLWSYRNEKNKWKSDERESRF